jgi:ABC-type sugar transport system permease subunit
VQTAETAHTTESVVSSGPSYATRRRVEGWLLVLPALLLIVGLTIFPLIQALSLSFQRWDLQS